MRHDMARAVADEIVSMLSPACLRLEIAGSIRREKDDDIHDVEIVAIPKPVIAVFGRPPMLPLISFLGELRRRETVTDRRDKRGRAAAGNKYQRLLWRDTPFDLFITDAACWGVIFTLRTGDGGFSRGLVTPRSVGGAMPDLMRCQDGRLWRLYGPHDDASPELLATPEERDVFAALGLPWIEPRERSEYTLRLTVRDLQ